MAESTLTLAYTDLTSAVGKYLGYSSTAANWTSTQTAEIDALVQAGYRQFLFPPGELAHVWSFLRPSATLQTFSDATGTVSGQGSYNAGTGVTTMTATTSVFYPLMVGKTFTFDTSTTGYTIASYTSGTVVAVTGDASAETSDDTFEILCGGVYTLPDDYGGMDGGFSYEPGEGAPGVVQTSEYSIRNKRQEGDVTGKPIYVAIRPKSSDQSAGQRFEALFYPEPDGNYLFYYTYSAYPNKLGASYPYHLGGMIHSETVKASCLAVAEIEMNDARGPEWERFVERITTSVAYDRKVHRAEYLGYNRDNSGGEMAVAYNRSQYVTINGSVPT